MLRRSEDLGEELAVQEKKEGRCAARDSDGNTLKKMCPKRHKI